MASEVGETEKMIYLFLDFFLENMFYHSTPDEEILILDILLRMAPKDDKELEEKVNDYATVNPNIPKEVIEGIFRYLMVRAKYFEARRQLLVGKQSESE